MPLRPVDWTQTSTFSEHNNSTTAAEIPSPPLEQRRKLRSYATPGSVSTYASLEGDAISSTSTPVSGTSFSRTSAPKAAKKKEKKPTRHSVKNVLSVPSEEGAILHQGLVKLAETYNIPDIAAAIEMSFSAPPPTSDNPPSSLKRRALGEEWLKKRFKAPLSTRDNPPLPPKRSAEPSPSEAWVQKRLRLRQGVPSLPLRPDPPPREKEKSQLPSRSASRFGTHGFGRTDERGRHYCTFIEPNSNQVCDSWARGYTTWADLARHADAKHASDEVEMIKKSLLTYETAQWVKSESQFEILKEFCGLKCSRCGTSFGSGRYDSLNRHKSNGACERVLKRLMLESSSFALSKDSEGGQASVNDDLEEEESP